MINRSYWIFPWIVLLLSCNGALDGQNKRNAGPTAALSMEKTDRKTNLRQQLLHYWDSFHFNDTALVSSPQVGEQKFVDFIALFPKVDNATVKEAIQRHLQHAEANAASFHYTVAQYDHYLYDPNSPMRSEAYYEAVLTYLLQSAKSSETDKIKYRTRLKLVSRNQPGSVAADFNYRTAKQEHQHLHAGNSNYKLLIFYDPDCSHCAAILDDLARFKVVDEWIADGKLQLLAICPLDNFQRWEEYQGSIPENWTNGFDDKGTILKNELYNIRAYPTIYLLDRKNTVLVKDAPLDATLRYLITTISNQ